MGKGRQDLLRCCDPIHKNFTTLRRHKTLSISLSFFKKKLTLNGRWKLKRERETERELKDVLGEQFFLKVAIVHQEKPPSRRLCC